MSLKRKPSKKMTDINAERRSLAVLCAESVKFFAEPCMNCEVDYVEAKNRYEANKKAAFTNALICLIAKDGHLRFETVLQVPVHELSHRSKGKLHFGYSEERVTPFTKMDWTPSDPKSADCLTEIGRTFSPKQYPAVVLAYARCACAIRRGWNLRQFALPKHVGALESAWTSTSDYDKEGDEQISFARAQQAKFYSSFESDVKKRPMSDEKLQATKDKVVAKKKGEMEKALEAVTTETEKSFEQAFASSSDDSDVNEKDVKSKKDESESEHEEDGGVKNDSFTPLTQVAPKRREKEPDVGFGGRVNVRRDLFDIAISKPLTPPVSLEEAGPAWKRRDAFHIPDEDDEEGEEKKASDEEDSSDSSGSTGSGSGSGTASKGGSSANTSDEEDSEPSYSPIPGRVPSPDTEPDPEPPGTPEGSEFGSPNEDEIEEQLSEDDKIDEDELNRGKTRRGRRTGSKKFDHSTPKPKTSKTSKTSKEVVIDSSDEDSEPTTTKKQKRLQKRRGTKKSVATVDESSDSENNDKNDTTPSPKSKGKGLKSKSSKRLAPIPPTRPFHDPFEEDKFDDSNDEDVLAGVRNRAERPEFATSQEATEDDPGVPEDLWEVDDDDEVNVNPTKSRPVFIRETKKTVKELFETLLESMESVEGEKLDGNARAMKEKPMQSLQFVVHTICGHMPPAAMTLVNEHLQVVTESFKKANFLIDTLQQRCLKAEARESIVLHANMKMQHKLRVLSELASEAGSAYFEKYEDYINTGNYNKVIEEMAEIWAADDDEAERRKRDDFKAAMVTLLGHGEEPPSTRCEIKFPAIYEKKANRYTGIWITRDKQHQLELLQVPEKDIVPCVTTKTLQHSGNKYRALGRGIWVVDSLIEDLWERYKAMPKLDTRKKVESRCKVFITSLVNTFFRGGSGGLELPNYYRDHPNPLTALKIGRIRALLKSFADRFISECHLSGIPGDKIPNVTRTADFVMSAVAQFAANVRADHITRGRDPLMVCPGQFLHPANFIKFKDEYLNSKDRWWLSFNTAFDEQARDFVRESIMEVKTRGKTQKWSLKPFLKKAEVSKEDEAFLTDVGLFNNGELTEFRNAVEAMVIAKKEKRLNKAFLRVLKPEKFTALLDKNLAKSRASYMEEKTYEDEGLLDEEEGQRPKPRPKSKSRKPKSKEDEGKGQGKRCKDKGQGTEVGDKDKVKDGGHRRTGKEGNDSGQTLDIGHKGQEKNSGGKGRGKERDAKRKTRERSTEKDKVVDDSPSKSLRSRNKPVNVRVGNSDVDESPPKSQRSRNKPVNVRVGNSVPESKGGRNRKTDEERPENTKGLDIKGTRKRKTNEERPEPAKHARRSSRDKTNKRIKEISMQLNSDEDDFE